MLLKANYDAVMRLWIRDRDSHSQAIVRLLIAALLLLFWSAAAAAGSSSTTCICCCGCLLIRFLRFLNGLLKNLRTSSLYIWACCWWAIVKSRRDFSCDNPSWFSIRFRWGASGRRVLRFLHRCALPIGFFIIWFSFFLQSRLISFNLNTIFV